MDTISIRKQKNQLIIVIGLYISAFLVLWYGLVNYFWDSALDTYLLSGLAIAFATFLYHIYFFISGIGLKVYSNWWKTLTVLLVLITLSLIFYLVNII
ncbi:MAG: hypothetical protein V3U71_13470 [Cocleimonas sp.]